MLSTAASSPPGLHRLGDRGLSSGKAAHLQQVERVLEPTPHLSHHLPLPRPALTATKSQVPNGSHNSFKYPRRNSNDQLNSQ